MDLRTQHHFREIPTIVVSRIVHVHTRTSPKLTKYVTSCLILLFGRDCHPDHTSRVTEPSPPKLAGFRDDGHNP
jgi:hypothetical protein